MINQNPFATALGSANGNNSSRSFTEALSSVSGQNGAFNPSNNKSSYENNNFNDRNNSSMGEFGFPGGVNAINNGLQPDYLRNQQDSIKKQEYERKRLELHKRINPIDTKDIFDAKKEQTKKKINQIKKDLKNLAKEIKKFHKEIDITLMGRTVDPGLDGIGDESFFDKLRAAIIFWTQQIRSGITWARQQNQKKKKIANRAKGLGKQMAESSGYEQRANMDQFFNSERGDNFGE